jgi:AAA15 family ATPase/GTPase
MARFLSTEIKNFKKFNDLKVKSFNKNINFIYGKNSVGKTSLLEAIFLLLCYSPNQHDPNLLSSNLHAILRYQFYKVINYNSLYPYQESVFKSLWDTIFRNPEKIIELTTELEDGGKLSLSIYQGFNNSGSREVTLKWNYTENNNNKESQTLQYKVTETALNMSMPPYSPYLPFSVSQPQGSINKQFNLFYMPSMFPFESTTTNTIYSGIVKANKKKEFIDKLKIVEHDIEEMELISSGLNTVVIRKENVLLPISQMGEGFLRIFYIIGLSLTHENGIILIDEIENGLHWSIQKEIFKNILSLSEEFNIQYFIATHSAEFVQEGLKGLEDDDINRIGVTRIIKKDDDIIYTSPLSGKDLKDLIEENAEFR